MRARRWAITLDCRKCPHFLRLLARPKPVPDRLHISHALQRLPYQSGFLAIKAVTHLVIAVSEI